MDTRSQKLRSFFLHLVALVAVWTLVISTLTVILTGINLLFPDIATDYYWSTENFVDTLRIAASFLIVALPVTLITHNLIKKNEALQTEPTHVSIRVLEYITLFAAGLTILGRLVYQINDLLGGEYAPRSIWKTIAIIVILGIVVLHYWGRLNRPTWYTAKTQTAIRWIVVIGTIACLVIGIVSAGSPLEARNKKLDDRKENDVQTIYSQIQNEVFQYRYPEATTTVRAFPDDVNTLFENTPYITRLQFPMSEYKYTKISDREATLCTEFKTDTREDNGRIEIGQGGDSESMIDVSRPYPYYDYHSRFTLHPEGNHCFNLSIDAERKTILVK